MKYRIIETTRLINNQFRRVYLAQRQMKLLWVFPMWVTVINGRYGTYENAAADIEHDKHLRQPDRVVGSE